MSVHLRLHRHGSTNRPFYHIVAVLKGKARDSRPLEKLGEYDPIPQPTLRQPPPAWAPQMGVLVPDARIDINGLLGRMHHHRYWKLSNINRPPDPKKDPYDNEGQVVHSGIARTADVIRQKHVEWNKERLQFWLSNGAQPTATVAKLLIKGGLLPPGRVMRNRFLSLWGDTVHDSVALGHQRNAKESEKQNVLEKVSGGVVIHAREPPKAPGPGASVEEVEAHMAELKRYNDELQEAKQITSNRDRLSDEQVGYDAVPEKLLTRPGGFLTQTTKGEWKPVDQNALPNTVTEELADRMADGLRLIESTPALSEWAHAQRSRFVRRVQRRREWKRFRRDPRLLPKPEPTLENARKMVSEFRRMGRMPPANLLIRHHQLRVAYAMKYHIPAWPLQGTPHFPRI